MTPEGEKDGEKKLPKQMKVKNDVLPETFNIFKNFLQFMSIEIRAPH